MRKPKVTAFLILATAIVAVVAWFSIDSHSSFEYTQCPGGKCPNQKAPAWRPQSPENSTKYPAVVHVNFQWERQTVALGSGFVADRDADRNTAVVITCAHGYKPLMNIEVVTQDGRAFMGKILGVDMANDLLIVQIKDPGITPLVIAENVPNIGDKAVMVGFPGMNTIAKVSEGKVTGWYSPADEPTENYVETSCEAEHGCSGGPVLNDKDEVICTVTGTFGGSTCVGPCLAKTLHLVKCKEVQ